MDSVDCKKCRATGKIRRDVCATCAGSGQVFVEEAPTGGVIVTPAPAVKE